MRLKLPAIALFCCLCLGSFGQCPSGADLCKAVNDSRKNPDADIRILIVTLLKVEKQAATCQVPIDSGLVSLHQRLAALYFNSDHYSEAARYIDQSLTEYNQSPRKQDPKFKAKIFFTQGMIYKSVPDVDRAVRALDSAIFYFLRYPTPGPQLVLAYKNLSNLQFQLGDYARALLLAERSVAESRSLADSTFESLARIEKAMALEALERYQEALSEIIKADSLSNAAEFPVVEKGNLFSVRASIERKLNQFAGALRWYGQCADVYRQAESTSGMLLASNNIGDIYLNDLRDAKKALPYFIRALQLARSSYDSLRVFSNIGDVYQAGSEFQKALTYYQRGLQCVFPKLTTDPSLNPTPEQLAATPNLEYVFTLITNKSICWSKKQTGNAGAIINAIRGYRIADKMVDALSWENFMSASRIYWRSKTHQLYEQAISACYATRDLASAFYFFEKSRAVVLNERMHETRLLTGSSRNLLGEIAALRRSINSYKDHEQAINVSMKATDDKNYLKLQERYEFLMSSIRKTHPYIFSTFLDTAYASMASTQKRLRENQQELLETFVGDSSVFIFHLTPVNGSIQRVQATEYRSLLSPFLVYCRDQEKLNTDYAGFCFVSSKLLQLVMGNFKFSTKRLVISPDGEFFPFDALKKSANANVNDFLVNDYAISYAYASRSILSSHEESPNAAGFLGVAPVQFQAAFHLPELAGSDQSLKSISNSMGTKKILLADEASKGNFLQQFYRYECLQLYTHAADSSARNEPVIFLSDSLLYLSDLIPEAEVRTRLVVLSACETGLGKWSKGEGVFSFNRGFAELGIPATVSTLWPIDNQSMYEVTELFYKFLSEGLNKDEALQQAKLAFIGHAEGIRKLPSNWAAAVLIGDTSPLTFRNDHKKTIVAVMAVIVLLGAISMYFLQRKRNRSSVM